MPLAEPVFVCGALRSGSTLLHLMLDHHTNIDNPGEFDFMFDLVKDDGGLPELTDYHAFLENSRIFKSKNLTVDFTLTFPALLQSFVAQLSKENQVLALNVHRNFHYIPALFPNAKYIHLLRDPRDVARSIIEMGWSGNVYYGVNQWLDTEQSWDKIAILIKPDRFTTVYYEKLIENPEAGLNSLCEFIGITYTASMLDYPLHSTYKKPDKSLTQQWKRKLSPREIQYVEAKANTLMAARDYALSGLPLIQVGAVERLKLALQNKLFRVKSGIKRYGILLYSGEKMTNFLGFKKWHTKLYLMRDEINRQNLR
jgi:LPS sulfotransferase NodH